MPSPALPFQINPWEDWLVADGDSKVVWAANDPPQGYIGPMVAEVKHEQAKRLAPAGGWIRRKDTSIVTPSFMPMVSAGLSGANITTLWDTRTTRLFPVMAAAAVGRTGRPRFLKFFSINDGGNMDLANWNIAHGSDYFDAIEDQGVEPTDILGIAVDFGPSSGGETFNVGTGGAPAARASLQASNDFYASFCASRGYYYVDLFGTNISQPNKILSKLAAVSPGGGAAQGLYTIDGNHVSAQANPGGSVQACLYNGQAMIWSCLKPNLSIAY